MSRFVTYSTAGLLSLLGGLALAQSPEPIQVDIGAQPVGDALNEFAEQSGLQVVLYADDARGIDVAGVSGQFDDAAVALDSLLASTGLEYSFINDRTVAVTPVQKVAEERGDSDSGNGRKVASRRVLMAQGQTSVEQNQASRSPETDSDKDEKKRPLEEIVVTGTNIRGIAPDSSPSFVFDREDIAKTGFGTVPEFIHSLPQNFGGGANADTVGGGIGDRPSARNNVSGASVNLRGAGSGNTLVLLNGSRLAPAAELGAFVDISMIPLSAVERVEVLTDGASAIYGADAIAGVVNFVLRDDYDGAETFFRFGAVTEGDLNEARAGQIIGKKWDSGNAMISYEFHNRGSLGAEDRDFASASPLPSDLLPEQESHSVLLAAAQQLNDRVKLRGHGTYAQRDRTREVNLGGNNPITRISDSEQYGGTGGGAIQLWGDWLFDMSGAYSKQTDFFGQDGLSPVQQRSESDLWSVDGKLDGTIFSLPGGDVKLATGLNYREETFSHRIIASVFGNEGVTSEDDRRIFSAFVEAFIPLLGESIQVRGVERLELTLAGRYDDYSDFDSTFNPKVGLLWSPVDGLNFRGTYSTSFKPPNLADTGNTGGFIGASVVPNPASVTGESLAILDFSANPGLGPETSTAWTAGIDYSRDVGPGGVDVSLTWFDIRYKDRIDTGGDTAQYLSDPLVFAELIFADPDPAETAALIAAAPRFVNFDGVWTMPGDEDFILDGRLVNLARLDTSGLDVHVAYSVYTDIGQLNFGLNTSYLFKQERQLAALALAFDVVDTLFNPVDLRVRGSASWSLDGWNATTFINYVGSYVDDRDLLGMGDVPISSWTTVDLNLSYDTGEASRVNFLDHTKLSFSVLNLFNEDPPTIEPAVRFSRTDGFDPTNASALGRFISFQITKAWGNQSVNLN